jgi:ribosomal protein L30E
MTTIKDALKDKKKTVFGRAQVIKLLNEGKLAEVFLSSNTQDKNKIESLSALSNTKINLLKQTNDELGAVCKKPFAISIVGLKK